MRRVLNDDRMPATTCYLHSGESETLPTWRCRRTLTRRRLVLTVANRVKDTSNAGIATGNRADTPSSAATTSTPTTDVAARYAVVTRSWVRAATAWRKLVQRVRCSVWSGDGCSAGRWGGSESGMATLHGWAGQCDE